MESHHQLHVFLPRLRLALGQHGIPLEQSRVICEAIQAGIPPQPVTSLKAYWHGRSVNAAMEDVLTTIADGSQVAKWNTALCHYLFDFEGTYEQEHGTQLGRLPAVEDTLGSC